MNPPTSGIDTSYWMNFNPRPAPIGWWQAATTTSLQDPTSARRLLGDLSKIVAVVETKEGLALAVDGHGGVAVTPEAGAYPLLALLPKVRLASLGDPSFCQDFGIRYPYLTGAMANGIASVEIVEAMSRAGMMGFFGAAGLSLGRIEAAIDRLQKSLPTTPWGVNLIHSPNEPAHEAATVDLLIRRGVRCVEASAYLGLTPAVLRYRLHGIRALPDGRVETRNRILAKVSRTEVATRFLAPAPESMLRELVAAGHLTAEQAVLAGRVPVAEDLTVEADSGGHTDNRPAITLLPTIQALRDRLATEYNYDCPLRIGAAGGIATPASAAAVFAMGAAYIVTGTVNQACCESGSSDLVREMLAESGQADVAMAPAADMFEMGVKVQVLKRGTMFPMRAGKLYELYRAYTSLEAIPEVERLALEKNLFRAPLESIWRETVEYFTSREPGQIEKANRDPRHKMALLFRWYLGLSSRWANAGDPSRKVDYQVWCGPAMGAFNEWTRGTFLEIPQNRRVVTVARNLLHGAGVVLRQIQLRTQGIHLPPHYFPTEPLEPAILEERLKELG